MDPLLQKMCSRYCRDSLVITRNAESQEVLGKLGVATELGTDTAWTFEPLGPEYGRKALRDAGWDGATPVLAVCPINPFWWPVKPSLAKWIAHSIAGAYEKSHYRTIYFHRSGAQVDAAYEKYLSAMAAGVDAVSQVARRVSGLVAMEMLDRDACERVAEKLGGAPIFCSDRYNMYEIVSILRACDRMLSSRFHAIVTSMPAGVPSAGVTMDERIRNLMRERGHEHLLMRVDEPDLERQDRRCAPRPRRRGRGNSRRHGPHRRAQPSTDGAHGHVFRGASRAALSRNFRFARACSAGKIIFRRSALAFASCSKRTAECWPHDVSRNHFRAARKSGGRAGAARNPRRANRLSYRR